MSGWRFRWAQQVTSGTDPDRYAAKVLATVLGDDSGSRMYWALVDPGKAEHASLHHSDYHGVGKRNRLAEFTTAPEVFAAIEAQARGTTPVVRP